MKYQSVFKCSLFPVESGVDRFWRRSPGLSLSWICSLFSRKLSRSYKILWTRLSISKGSQRSIDYGKSLLQPGTCLQITWTILTSVGISIQLFHHMTIQKYWKTKTDLLKWSIPMQFLNDLIAIKNLMLSICLQDVFSSFVHSFQPCWTDFRLDWTGLTQALLFIVPSEKWYFAFAFSNYYSLETIEASRGSNDIQLWVQYCNPWMVEFCDLSAI